MDAETPPWPPRLRGDLASWLLVAPRVLDPDEEKTRPDAGKGPEGYVCQATLQSISELQGTVPRRHSGPSTATPTHLALHTRRGQFPPEDPGLFSAPGRLEVRRGRWGLLTRWNQRTG